MAIEVASMAPLFLLQPSGQECQHSALLGAKTVKQGEMECHWKASIP
jgi:hypothetical protein